MNTIEKEFVPYKESLELKELGFNEPCFGYYNDNNEFTFFVDVRSCNTNTEFGFFPTAPTFSQAFRWFRKNYRLTASITPCSDGEYIFTIYNLNKCDLDIFVEDIEELESENTYDEYEEAELACLKELIKIVKNKQNEKNNIN